MPMNVNRWNENATCSLLSSAGLHASEPRVNVNMQRVRVLTCLAALSLLISCRAPSPSQLEADNPVRPSASAPFGLDAFFANAQRPVPSHVRLGRWLFFDRRLSADNSISCASCHRPEFAFSERTPVSRGIAGQPGRRKTPSVVNLGAHTILPDLPDAGPSFFWDGRATSLEAQVLMPIADAREMGFEHPAMVARLSQITGYRPYFREAFGDDSITTNQVAVALADYVRSRMSGNAAYDRWSYGGEAGALSTQQQKGLDIFFFTGRCSVCHAGFNFSDGRFHNLGVGWQDTTGTFADDGRAAVSHLPTDRGRFKTPGLRDVTKHPPYMHDGSLATLRDVVEFYNRGGIHNPFLSARVRPLGLTSAEMDALVAFLESLDGEGYQDQGPRLFPR